MLLLDAGDIFQGTPYLITGGELEFKLMSMMQYDASTIEIMTLTMASKVYMRKCPNLNSYRPIMTLKIRSWKAR
jgi:hypothetical protein